jgi:hypothetical protein
MRDARSPRTIRLKAAAFLSAVVIAFTACGAPAPASGGPTGQPATQPATPTSAGASPTALSASPSAGVGVGVDLSDADRAAVAAPTLQRVSEYEAKVDATIAERSGQLAILGPEGVAFLAGDRSKAMKAILDNNKVKYSDFVREELTSAPMAAVHHEISIPGELVFGAMFTATAIVAISMDRGFTNPSGSGQPYTNTGTSQQTIGGHRISTSTTTTNVISWGGSIAIDDVTMNQTVRTVDAATGADLGTTTNRVHVRAEANGCPDANGIAIVKMDVEFTGDASGMAGGSRTEARSHSETTAQVDDAAEIASISDRLDMSYSTTSGGTTHRSTAITGLALPAGVSQQIDDGDVPPTEAASARTMMTMLTAMTAGTLLQFAKAKWQDGACVRIDATTARTRQVHPNEVVNFTAKPVHVVEGTDLDKPIVATFSGDGTLAPVDTSERPPVSYTYTAPSDKDKTGKVLLKSTSNRGIGLLNIVFRTVVKGWVIDQPSGGGRIMGRHCGTEAGEWVIKGTYVRPGQKGKQKWVIQIDGSTLQGTYTYTDDAVQNVVITVLLQGRARGKVTLTIVDGGRALMHFQETRHTYRTTVPAYPDAWGADQNAALAPPFDLAWEIDPTCP